MDVNVKPAVSEATSQEANDVPAAAGRRSLRRLSAQELKMHLTRFPQLYSRARRPYATARYLMRRPHDPDYAAFGLFPANDGLFLDVGANAGMSSMSLRLFQPNARIFAIEPNPFHEPDLRWTRRLVGRLEYGIFAAGDTPGVFEFFIPIYRGVPITAEASLTREAVEQSPSLIADLGDRIAGPDFRIERIEVEVKRVDDLCFEPAFVKLDVQGHEHAALLGMSRTLEAFGPPVLVEGPSEDATALMASLGYEPYAYDAELHRLVPLSGYATNVMFVRGPAPTRAS